MQGDLRELVSVVRWTMCLISITQKLAPFGFVPREPEYFSEREHETDSAIILAEFPEFLFHLPDH